MERNFESAKATTPNQGTLSERVWQSIAENPNHVRGHISAPSQPAEQLTHAAPPALTDRLPQVAMPTESEMHKLREDWNRRTLNGKPLNEGEHIKGFQAGTAESHLPNLTFNADESYGSKDERSAIAKGSPVKNVEAATSTNVHKRDQFDHARPTTPQVPGATGFEYSDGTTSIQRREK